MKGIVGTQPWRIRRRGDEVYSLKDNGLHDGHARQAAGRGDDHLQAITPAEEHVLPTEGQCGGH